MAEEWVSKEVPLTDEWMRWADLAVCIYEDGEKQNTHCFPIYIQTEQNWMVFKPYAATFMIVPDILYRERINISGCQRARPRAI